MAKKSSSHIVLNPTHSHLYTVDDIRRVNDMRVKCCKSSRVAIQGKTFLAKSFTAEELNRAWKDVKK